MQLEPLLGSVFKYVLDKPNFSTVLSESLSGTALNENFLENLSNELCLSACEKIGIGLALSDSENSDLRTCGVNYCMAQIGELLARNLCINSVEQIQNIFIFLHRSEGLSKHLDSFMKIASSMRLKEGNRFILSPLLPDELLETTLRKLDLFEDNEDEIDSIILEMEKEMSMADIMKELGYGCTANVPQCKEILSLFLPLTEIMVSKILGAIAQTHSEMEDNYSDFSTFCSALGCSLSDMPSLSSWNIDVLIDSINQLAPGINWMSVFESLDHEGFYFPDEAAFSFFMSVYRHTCKEPFPLHTICGPVWKNTEGQLSFLKYAVSVPPEVFNFAHSARQLAYFHAVSDHKFQLGHANHAWLCLELFEVLCQLAERGHVSDIRPMLKDPLEHCPEVLLLGMAHINTAYSLLQNEITSTVLPMMLKNSKASVVARHLWHVNPNLLLRGFLDTHEIDPGNMSRILDICQELKIVLPVLDMVPSYFGIRLAALASQKELIDMKKWLISNLSTYKDIFFEECLKLLKEILFGISWEVSSEHLSHSGAVWKLYSETSPTILKVLRAHKGLTICSQLSHELEKLHLTFMNATSRMKNYGADNLLLSDLEREEEVANSYFYKLFAGELTTDAMIKMLARLKESNEKREQSILKCIISILFEEYDFFSMYPEEQLKLTAILFGSLVKHRIVTDLTLGIALQGVLDALHKPADSKMFMFGTIALEQFLDRLIELPQYCNLILQIDHLRATHSELVAFAERALSRISSGHSESDLGHNADTDQQHGSVQATSTNMEVPVSSSSPIVSVNKQLGLQISSSTQPQQRHEACLEDTQKVSVSSSEQPCIKCIDEQPSVVDLIGAAAIQKSQCATSASAAPSSSSGFSRPSKPFSLARFGSALNIETLVAAAEKREIPSEAPASEIQENISFMINNLSAANIEAKAKEFTEILKERYYPWFAEYMVIKRASIEPNFHNLYLKFLDKVNSKTLQRDILQATYENCKVLLGSELIKSSSEERSLLKNLGSWLGKITIGKNQVLRAREIDPKSLIIQAYEKGLMIAVIPFTSKILEPCPSSLAYRPPNPWTMSILQLLAEIHAMPSLKMNLKFNIEVLFKNLDVDLKAEPPTSLLKDRVRKAEGNPDFSSKDARQQIVGAVKPGMPSTQNGVQLPLDIGSPSHPSGHSSLISQHPVSLQVSSATATEEKVLAVALSNQLPSVQRLLQQSPISDIQLQMSVSDIEQQITVNPKLHALGLHLQFQRAIPIAIDKAIKEVVSNIVQRTFSIASQTTREMILKDFAMELDETRIWNVVHLMVASLAASLAYIACKGHLRRSVTSQLRVSLQDLNIASELLEQAVQLVTDDNLDLGCALIVHAAKNKAIQSIDGEIGQQLSIRRKHIEDVGPKYFNSALHTQGRAGIYEELVWLPWLNQSKHSSKVPSVGSSASSAVSVGVSNRLTSSSGKLNPGLSSSGSRRAGFNADAEPFYLVPEWSSPPLHSVPSPFTRTTRRVGLQQLENDAIGASLPSASAPEIHSVETSNNTEVIQILSTQPLLSTSAREPLRSSASEPLLTTGEALEKYQLISEKVETLVTNGAKVADIQAVILEVPEIFLRCVSRDEAALAVAQKVFRVLYENASDTVHVAAHLAVLAAIRDASNLVVKELTSWVLYSDEERKFNKDITIGLIRHELLNLAEYNVYMAKMVDAGKNSAATEFAISLIETLLVNDSMVISELHDIIEALSKLAARAGSPKSLQYLVEVARNPAAYPTAVSVGEEDNTRQAPGFSAGSREDFNVLESGEPDLDGFYEKVTALFAEWHKITSLPGANDATFALYALKLQQSGMLKGDDNLDHFFHWLTKLSVLHCLASEMISSGTLQSEVQPISYFAIDLYAKLVFSIIKFFPPEQGSNNLSLLPKILAVIVKSMQKDAEEKKLSFDPRPFFRLFSDWLLDLISLDPICDVANFQVLAAFANAFHALQPLNVPGFSFAWIELVSHRNFMPNLLTGNAQKGWPYMQRLLVDLFQFLEPFTRKTPWPAPVQFLYKGTLRVLLVLKHDFPDFLSSYHFSFCDVIPQSCIQMQNIILSACPHNMRIPDPFTANLKIDPLVELTKYPCILSDVDAALREKQIKGDIDEYLKTRQQGSSFLTELKQKLLLLPRDASQDGTRYNVPLINSLVLYLGMQDVRQLHARTAHCTKSTASNDAAVFLNGPALDIFRTLLLDLDPEGCYLVLKAMANQLRYPNDLTSYFAVTLLHIFYESNQEAVQERITRVLSERLIVHEPHPWGVLVTFLELIKNPKYNFWSRSFTRCAPEEIRKFFQSVLRGRAGPIPVNQAGSPRRPSDNMN